MAEHTGWEKVTVVRYGRTESVFLAEVPCLCYGSFGTAVGRCVLVREEDSSTSYDLALFTVDATVTAAGVVRRYAVRRSIEGVERHQQAPDRCRAGPQPGAQGGRADRALQPC